MMNFRSRTTNAKEFCTVMTSILIFTSWMKFSSALQTNQLRYHPSGSLHGRVSFGKPSTPGTATSTLRRPFFRIEMIDSSIDDVIGDDFNFTKITDAGKLRKEAQTLKARAKSILAEARAMESELQESRFKQREERNKESDHLIEDLFPASKNSSDSEMSPSSTVPTKIVRAFKRERWSPDQVLLVVDRIFERQAEATGSAFFASTLDPQKNSTQKTEKRVNQTEYERLSDALDTLVEAVGILDNEVSGEAKVESKRWPGRVESTIRARIKELKRTQQLNFDRRMAAGINKIANTDESVEEFVRRTFGAERERTDPDANLTDSVDGVSLVPMWVPSSFLPFIMNSNESTIGADEVEAIKDDVLLGSRFYVTTFESVPGAALFRGNIRTALGGVEVNDCNNQTALVFEEILERLEKKGLDEKVQLFLMPDPEWRPSRDIREPEPKPVILALSKAVTPDESKIKTGKIAATAKKLAYPVSLVTTFAFSVSSYALNPNFFDSLVNRKDVRALTSCFPVFLGILSIQVIHELAHYFVAKLRKIKIGYPVPLPSPQLGLFGCITPLKSFPSTRTALLDLALSGPMASSLVSMAYLLGGILLTRRAAPAAIATFPVIPAITMKSSFLIGWLISCLSSKTLMIPPAQPVPMHPLFIVGYSGLIASALNLLPIFRLDGGRACSAAMGPRQGAVISVSVLLTILSIVFSGGSGLGFAWGMLVTILQRRPEIPALDEATEVNNFRLGAWFFSFLLSIAVLSPFPGAPGIL